MAGNAAAMRDYLGNFLNIPAAVFTEVVDVHGCDSMDVFAEAQRSELENLVSTIRKTRSVPGDPNSANIVVGQQFALRIHGLAMHAKHLQVTGRAHTNARGAAANVIRVARHHQALGKFADRDLPDYPTAFDNKNSRTMMEDIQSWLGKAHGRDNVLLLCVVRDHVDPDGADAPAEPGFLQPTIEQELVRRASHAGDSFAADNKDVGDMIRAATHRTDAWSIVKIHLRTDNGRGAFIALVSHYLGRGHISRIKTDARNMISNVFWNGNSKNFSWDAFRSRVQGAFDDLEAHGDPRSEGDKVTTLLEKVEKDASLAAASTFIRNDQTLSEDFDSAMNYLTGEVMQTERKRGRTQCRNISSLTSRGGDGGRGAGRGHWRPRGGGGGRGRGRGGGRGRGRGGGRDRRGTDRYSANGILLNDGACSGHVWWDEFSQEDRDYVLDLRARRDRRENRNNNRDNNDRNLSNLDSRHQDQNGVNISDRSNNNSNAGNGMTRRRNGGGNTDGPP